MTAPPSEAAGGTSPPAASRLLLWLIVTGSLLGLFVFLAGIAMGRGWSPLAFLVWSGLGSALLMGLAVAATEQLPPLSTPLLRYALLSGLISFTLPNAISFLAIPHVGAGFVALCLAFSPILTYGLAIPLKLDRLSAIGAAGMALGLGGAGLLALSQVEGGGGWFWILAAMSAPAALAAGNIYRTWDWPAGVSGRILAPAMVLTGSLGAGLAALASGATLAPPDWSRAALEPLVAQVLLLAIYYNCHFVLQRIGGPVVLSQISWVGALVGKGAAVVWLGERAPPGLIPAFLLVLLGVILVSKRPR